MKNKIWFITGASQGLGRSLAENLLAAGYCVATTSRSITDLENNFGKASKTFLPLQMDIGNEQSVAAAIKTTVDHFGAVNVIVNNAGYGLTGALEELTDAETRKNFDINVFGSINVIRQALPYLRKQQSGHIFNVSSIGGFTGLFPGFGIYCATKFAVHGFSESLSEEVKPFGIHVTIVSPGYFRTNFLSGSSLNIPQHPMAEYENVRAVENAHQDSINGNQPGDPEKAAAVFIAVASQANPPLHLFLGQDAYDLAAAKIKNVEMDMAQVKEIATATGF